MNTDPKPRNLHELITRIMGCEPEQLNLGTTGSAVEHVNMLDLMDLCDGKWREAANRVRAARDEFKTRGIFEHGKVGDAEEKWMLTKLEKKHAP